MVLLWQQVKVRLIQGQKEHLKLRHAFMPKRYLSRLASKLAKLCLKNSGPFGQISTRLYGLYT